MKPRCFSSFIGLLLVMFWGSVCRVEAQQAVFEPEVLRYADTVLYNGKILTADVYMQATPESVVAAVHGMGKALAGWLKEAEKSRIM